MLGAKLVNTAFAPEFATLSCKLGCNCLIYHLSPWFPPSLHFFASYLPRANIWC